MTCHPQNIEMSQFSTNESISLEKRIDLKSNIHKIKPENLNSVYEIENCAKWIQDNNYQNVCLQFPDYLLPNSAEIVFRLESIIGKKVYILGDTAYESCCIDYTSAKHISADAIIHFGPTCFSKTENIIPYLKVFEKFDLNVEEFGQNVQKKFIDEQNDVTIMIDTPYLHKIDNIKEFFKETTLTICSVEDNLNILNSTVLYLGENDRKLMNVNMIFCPKQLYYYDPKTSSNLQNYNQDTKVLKRRYFLIEKIKDSNTIGIVICTLAVQNYLTIIERLKTLIKLHNKKYYVISVGKPNVAKLANFPEVDIFVVIGCAMNEIYENREFYKPLVTPFDVESALNSKLSTDQFSYDFNQVLKKNHEIDTSIEKLETSDVSLLTGKIRYHQSSGNEKSDSEKTNENVTNENQIAVRSDGKVALNDSYGGGFLAGKSWQGLEQNLGKDEAQLATKGRKGIAFGYENEKE